MKNATFTKTLAILALALTAAASASSHARDRDEGEGFGAWKERPGANFDHADQSPSPWLRDRPAPQVHAPSHGADLGRHDDRQDRAELDARQRCLVESFLDGVASGRLSGEEARKLVRERLQIENAERRYLADGRLDRRERFELDRMLDDAASHLRAEKRDGEWRNTLWR